MQDRMERSREPESPPRWLTVFLDFPERDLERGVAFWCEATGARRSPWRGAAAEFATLVPARGNAYMRVQRVHGGLGGCHLDLHVAGSLMAAASRAQTLGAQVLSHLDDLVLAQSPGGFAFCLTPWESESAVPPAVDFGLCGAARADQLCLDIPPGRHDAECRFWAALTGWELRPGSRPEFFYLERPAEIPVRLLLQRRATAAPDDTVTAHIDFACADPGRIADQHTALGATQLARFPHWLAMADPTGRPYCLTTRDPATGKLREP